MWVCSEIHHQAEYPCTVVGESPQNFLFLAKNSKARKNSNSWQGVSRFQGRKREANTHPENTLMLFSEVGLHMFSGKLAEVLVVNLFHDSVTQFSSEKFDILLSFRSEFHDELQWGKRPPGEQSAIHHANAMFHKWNKKKLFLSGQEEQQTKETRQNEPDQQKNRIKASEVILFIEIGRKLIVFRRVMNFLAITERWDVFASQTFDLIGTIKRKEGDVISLELGLFGHKWRELEVGACLFPCFEPQHHRRKTFEMFWFHKKIPGDEVLLTISKSRRSGKGAGIAIWLGRYQEVISAMKLGTRPHTKK